MEEATSMVICLTVAEGLTAIKQRAMVRLVVDRQDVYLDMCDGGNFFAGQVELHRCLWNRRVRRR